MHKTLTFALSKGRIFKETVPLLAEVGIVPKEDPETSRKLIIETSDPSVRLLVIRATDVPAYVRLGAADLGVAGKDILREQGSDGFYEPIDLRIARCRMMVAGPAGGSVPNHKRVRVATKFIESAREYFAQQGRQVEMIKLYGSMELAPLVGLADCIVDLVDTGNTLRANGLEPWEHIADVSSWLIVNKASMKMKHDRVKRLIDSLDQVIRNRT